MEYRMLIITKEAKRVIESRVFRRILLGSDFPGETLDFPDYKRSEYRRETDYY